jgi:hypothetical protein
MILQVNLDSITYFLSIAYKFCVQNLKQVFFYAFFRFNIRFLILTIMNWRINLYSSICRNTSLYFKKEVRVFFNKYSKKKETMLP